MNSLHTGVRGEVRRSSAEPVCLPPIDSEPSSATQPTRRRDRGTSLIEIVITLSLLGVVVAALMSSVRTSVIVSSEAYDISRVETVLLNASDRVNRARQSCDYTEYAQAAARAEKWAPELVTVKVERLRNPTGNPNTDWVPESCSSSVNAFDVQRVTITATTPKGDITRTMSVVKSSLG